MFKICGKNIFAISDISLYLPYYFEPFRNSNWFRQFYFYVLLTLHSISKNHFVYEVTGINDLNREILILSEE